MADANGKTWWIRWLVGALWGILTVAFITLANNVIANDKESRNRDDRAQVQLAAFQKDMAEVQTSLKYIERNVLENTATGREILRILKSNG